MGYWMFIFEHQKWYDLYEKNCSLKSQEEWLAEGSPNIFIGLLYFLSGLFFELSYIPFMIAMAKKEFFQHSCYKFMFMIGIFDIFILPCNGIITGYQVIKGEHFCNNPKLYYFTGVIGDELTNQNQNGNSLIIYHKVWLQKFFIFPLTLYCISKLITIIVGFYGVTTQCVILAFDRFLGMCFPRLAKYIFGNLMSYLWMCIPIIYQCYVGFQLPHIFCIKIFAVHHDPYHFIDGMENNPNFNFKLFQTFFAWNNSLIILLLILFYGGLLVVLKINTRMFNATAISKAQKHMTIQAICVCGEMLAAPLLHIFMLFWELPICIEVVAHFSWICLHGDTPIIYFILNKSLRYAVIEMSASLLENLKSLFMKCFSKYFYVSN